MEVRLTRVFFYFGPTPSPSEGSLGVPDRLCWGHLVFGLKTVLWSRSAWAGESSATSEQETGCNKVRVTSPTQGQSWMLFSWS